MFILANGCGIMKRKKEGPKPRTLLLFSLRPFGRLFPLRFNYQADGGNDGEKRF